MNEVRKISSPPRRSWIILLIALAVLLVTSGCSPIGGTVEHGANVVSVSPQIAVGKWRDPSGVGISIDKNGTFKSTQWPTLGTVPGRDFGNYSGSWGIMPSNIINATVLMLNFTDSPSGSGLPNELDLVKSEDGSLSFCINVDPDNVCSIERLMRQP